MEYGYIRVSSDKQTVENQRFEINNFCSYYRISGQSITPPINYSALVARIARICRCILSEILNRE